MEVTHTETVAAGPPTPQRTTLDNGVDTRKGPPQNCPVKDCYAHTQVFAHPGNYQQHIQRQHWASPRSYLGKGSYQCHRCPTKLSGKPALIKHLRNVHHFGYYLPFEGDGDVSARAGRPAAVRVVDAAEGNHLCPVIECDRHERGLSSQHQGYVAVAHHKQPLGAGRESPG